MVQISENSDESDNLTHSTLTLEAISNKLKFTYFIILSTTIHILDIGNKTEHVHTLDIWRLYTGSSFGWPSSSLPCDWCGEC